MTFCDSNRIKVLYDITILANNFRQTDPKTGIYRATEELLLQLLSQDNIDLSLTCICSPDPAASFINFPFFIKEHAEFRSLQYECHFKSRIGLDWLYKLLYSTYYSKEFQKLNKYYSPKSLLVRGMLKLIDATKLHLYDLYHHFDADSYNILHSTYYKLPSEEITKNLQRLLMIHDLIPLKFKEFVSKQLSSYFDSILRSINYDRDWVVCNSEYTRNEFCEYTGMDISRTFVTYLAADSKFSCVNDIETIQLVKKRYRIPEADYFLCLASHLEPRKNIPHLINSFIALITEHTDIDANLVIAGTTRYRRPDIDQVMKNIIFEYRNRIIITGYISDEDLSAVYSGATAFIFPSLYEGFGLPVLEAMQCGTPVISSNSTSLPEIVGDAGILVNPKDQDQLCQSMLNVLQNTQLRDLLRHKGIKRAKQFSWQKCANETLDIYKTILGNRN